MDSTVTEYRQKLLSRDKKLLEALRNSEKQILNKLNKVQQNLVVVRFDIATVKNRIHNQECLIKEMQSERNT